MVKTESTMLSLGTEAPPFRLPDTDGRMVSLDDFADAPGYLVMFICNHCPFVKHVREELARLGKEYQARGFTIVGINSNDIESYPDDNADQMREEIRTTGYTFPYLLDETQEIAKAYRAACTPDFFLFDGDRKLVYRGQLDDSRPGNDAPVTGSDLRAALDALLERRPIPADQRPGIGCNTAGERCLVGERSPDEFTYVFSDFDLATGRGNEVLRIEGRPPFTNWNVSPDGSRPVVGHNDDRLRIFDLATGEETVLTHEGLLYGEFPVWSADGRGLFVDGGYGMTGSRVQKGLLYISLEDGKVHVLRLNWGEWDTHPLPSADGKRLAFAANFFYDGNAWMVEGF